MRRPSTNADVDRCGMRKIMSGILFYKSIGYIYIEIIFSIAVSIPVFHAKTHINLLDMLDLFFRYWNYNAGTWVSIQRSSVRTARS